jgi:hypothetical protein
MKSIENGIDLAVFMKKVKARFLNETKFVSENLEE